MADRFPFCEPEVAFFRRLASAGWAPRTIYDVGASSGHWSASIASVFPDATCHLFEPLATHVQAYSDDLARTLKARPRFSLHPVACADSNGLVDLHVAQDFYSSSLLGHSSAKHAVSVPARRLYDFAADAGLPPPTVLKADVQGCEDAVLRGCVAPEGTFWHDRIEIVLVKSWLRRGYGPKTPLLTELIDMLRPFNMVLVELGNQYLTASSEILHVDAFFMKRSLTGLLRDAPALDAVHA